MPKKSGKWRTIRLSIASWNWGSTAGLCFWGLSGFRASACGGCTASFSGRQEELPAPLFAGCCRTSWRSSPAPPCRSSRSPGVMSFPRTWSSEWPTPIASNRGAGAARPSCRRPPVARYSFWPSAAHSSRRRTSLFGSVFDEFFHLPRDHNSMSQITTNPQRCDGRLVAQRPPIESETAGPNVVWITSRRGWRLINVGELFRYRELLWFLAARDVKVRYKQTLLGAAWAVLQPAMMMIVFTVFLGRLARVPSADLPYPLFVYAGLLPWTFFATAVANAGNSVVGSERLITKIYFPRLAIPFAAVGAAIIDFGIAMTLLAGMMIWHG